MYEEIGATKVELTPICVYKISAFALLVFCEVLEMGNLPIGYETSSILLSDDLPDNLTYPDTYKKLFKS